MNINDVELINYLDSIREKRNIPREDFLFDIVSERQYRRYLRGESSLLNNITIQLINRLGLDVITVYSDFLTLNDTTLNSIKDSYTLLRQGHFKESRDLINKINKSELVSKYNRKFYRFCKILLDIKQNLVPQSNGFPMIAELVNYPGCLQNTSIDFVEIVALLSIQDYYSYKLDDERISGFLFNILSSDTFTKSNIHFKYYPSIYANVSKTLIRKEEYEKALYIVDLGIKTCEIHEIYNSLSNLLYYKAVCLKKLDLQTDIPTTLNRLKALLILENNKEKEKQYLETIDKHF